MTRRSGCEGDAEWGAITSPCRASAASVASARRRRAKVHRRTAAATPKTARPAFSGHASETRGPLGGLVRDAAVHPRQERPGPAMIVRVLDRSLSALANQPAGRSSGPLALIEHSGLT